MRRIAAAAMHQQDRDKPRLIELCPIGMPVLTQKALALDQRQRPVAALKAATVRTLV
jgi:hypothetical protein